MFTQLAQLEFSTRRYPDDLWEAADCYLEGHLFSAAGTTLEDYLKHELRRRRPLTLRQRPLRRGRLRLPHRVKDRVRRFFDANETWLTVCPTTSCSCTKTLSAKAAPW